MCTSESTMRVTGFMDLTPFTTTPERPGPDRRYVLVKYNETSTSPYVADIPQHGLFICELAELVFAHNAGPILLAETSVSGSLYGSVVMDGPHRTCEIIEIAPSEYAAPTYSMNLIRQKGPVGFDLVTALREDRDGQRWTLQAGIRSELQAGRNPSGGTSWELTYDTYKYVCDKWQWKE